MADSSSFEETDALASNAMNWSQLFIRTSDVLACLPDTITILPEDRSLFTRGKKSLSDDTMTNVSMVAGDWCSRSMASIDSFMSLEFLPYVECLWWIKENPS